MGCGQSTDAAVAKDGTAKTAGGPIAMHALRTGTTGATPVERPRVDASATSAAASHKSLGGDKDDGFADPPVRLNMRRASTWSLTEALQAEGLLQDGRYPESVLQRHLNDLNIAYYHGATMTGDQYQKLLEAVKRDEEEMQRIRTAEHAQHAAHEAERGRWAEALAAARAAYVSRVPPGVPPLDDAAFAARLRAVAQGSFKEARGLEVRPEAWLYVSSGFGDTDVERSYLQEFVFPDLLARATELGVSFNPVDLRWGVETDLSDSHNFAALCLSEVERCVRANGAGVSFLKLSGQRYASRVLPRSVLATDMDALVPHVSDPATLDLLASWYKKDDNAVPEHYVLQRTSVAAAAPANPVPHFGDDLVTGAPGAQTILSAALRTAAASAGLSGGELDACALSVAHRELLAALDPALNPSPGESMLMLVRTLTGVDAAAAGGGAQAADAARFCSRGEDAALLQAARAAATTALGPGGAPEFVVPWCPGGPTLAVHGDYVRSMCARVYLAVEESLRATQARTRALTAAQRELVSTAGFVQRRARAFLGRPELLHSAQLLAAPGGGRVRVLHGTSGMGKTSVLSAVAYGAPGLKMLRKCGYSWGASSATALLAGACAQLALATGRSEPLPHDLQGLSVALVAMLGAATADAPISLFVDSLDLLSDEDGGRTDPWLWLPRTLPPHVSIMVSTGPDDLTRGLGLLRALRGGGVLSDADFLEVPPVPPEEGQELLAKWLHSAGRKVTNRQWQELTAAIAEAKAGRPILYLKLLYDASVKWQSTQPPIKVPRSVSGVIDDLFNRLEQDHGALLVGRTLGLLCASKNGLSEANLMDLISASDDILCWAGVRGGVLEHHTPALRRIPPLVFKRLVAAMREYLVERSVGEATVLVFFHRQFKEQAERRYISSEAMRQFLSRFLSFYFSGLRLGDAGEMAREYPRRGIASHCTRAPASQGRPARVVRSAQALSELSAALLKSGAIFHTELLSTLCDPDAIEAKIDGGLLDELLADMAEAEARIASDGTAPPGHASGGHAGADEPVSPTAGPLRTTEGRRLLAYHRFLLENAHLVRGDSSLVRRFASSQDG